jgi:hypothetical protein
MKNKIRLNDFTFRFNGYGHYEVTYTSPVTYNKYTTITNNMPLIDLTKGNWDSVRIKDLNELKKLCKTT